jgi:hypothetical protein
VKKLAAKPHKRRKKVVEDLRHSMGSREFLSDTIIEGIKRIEDVATGRVRALLKKNIALRFNNLSRSLVLLAAEERFGFAQHSAAGDFHG